MIRAICHSLGGGYLEMDKQSIVDFFSLYKSPPNGLIYIFLVEESAVLTVIHI